MAENIVRTHRDIVDAIDFESLTLKTGLHMIDETLTFDRSSEEAVSQAQDQIYFITAALGESQKRLERLSADVTALRRAEKMEA